jgi:LPXTG-motif cell wall-anchored protein
MAGWCRGEWRQVAAGSGSKHRQDEEAIVRNPVRKIWGVALVGVLGALFAFPMLAAGAQSGEGGVAPAPPGDCVILSVAPNPVPAFGTQVSITGTAPNGVTIVLFANGSPATANSGTDVVSQLVTDNTFSLKYTVNSAVDLSVNFTFGNQNAYTAGCATPAGEVVVRVDVAGQAVTRTPTAQAQALAFTGSNDTPSYVLVGVAALVVGGVLVVAARRRRSVS